MFSTDLEIFLKKDKFAKRIFCGVLAINQIPLKQIIKPCGFIINNQESDEKGEHWFAIYLPKQNHPEYFDSYGIAPQDIRIKRFLKKNGQQFIFNNQRLQSDESQNCGKFCILYLYFKARNYSMKNILKFFTNNFVNNDLFIEKFFEKIK